MAAPDWVINGFGVIAGLCSMASFVPQIFKIARERDARGVSLHMYGVTIFGFSCWTTYGVLSHSWPIVLSNGVCIVLAVAIFILRLRFGDGRG